MVEIIKNNIKYFGVSFQLSLSKEEITLNQGGKGWKRIKKE